MSAAKLVSSSESTLQCLCSKPESSSRPENISSVSFTSQVAKSRISIRGSQCQARCGGRVRALYAPGETRETLYELLGIAESGSTLSDIKKAYKKMARKYHPDVSPPDRVDEYTRRFIMVHEAYETLSNPQKRAMYDRDLVSGLSGFEFSATQSTQQCYQESEWKMQWRSQLDGLKQRAANRNSWGARMRSRR